MSGFRLTWVSTVFLLRLFVVLMDDSFRDEGECQKRQIPVSVFVHDPEHPAHEDLVWLAKETCRECPVQAECFLFGMKNGEVGVWGGAWLELPPETSTDKP